jgi:hypothetical protein
MTRRIVSTVVVSALYAIATYLYTPQATLLANGAAGHQFDNSDAAYVASSYVIQFLTGISGLFTLVLAIALLVIWAKPIGTWLASLTAIAVCGFLAQGAPAHAFFSQADKTEAYTILPNESAFWVPDVGANKDSQNQLDSEEFLRANKLAVKRFVIPHAKLSNSGGAWNWDYYVPTGRLIIVDRTPYSREWVDAHDRGTSAKKEGFPCQSKEGLNITAGVSIGVSVTETNSPKYLYHFGILPAQGDRSNGEVIFTSVYYSRRLADVMDDVGRKKVQTLVCSEIGSRKFDDANADMNLIMEKIKTQAEAYFASVGITLDFIGWADTFTFDKPIQDAVNRVYIATQDEAIARKLQPYTEVIEALAAAQALRAFGEKTDGKLPTTIVGLPPQTGALLSTLLKANETAPAPTSAK